MKFITSISRHRIERQQYCMNTWLTYGDITAVQTADDIEFLSPLFPQVNFVNTTLTGAEFYGLPNRVRIKALVDQGPGLLINSDIKLDTTHRDFTRDWKTHARQFSVGIRYDFDGPGKPKVLNRYGVDAFLISEEVMALLPDLGFVIGVSVWDYWIIWHMMTERFRIKPKTTPGLLHLRHTQNWDERETQIGLSILQSKYGLDDPKKLLDKVIPIVTDRN